MKLEGGCFCKAVRYCVAGEPLVVTHCHCEHCRRSSGAPFLTWAEFRINDFRYIAGRAGTYESKPLVTRSYCRECGTQLTYQHRRDEHRSIDVTVCSLDEPTALVPQNHVWCERMLPWILLDDGLPRHAFRRSKS
jgi:hypothetical protein